MAHPSTGFGTRPWGLRYILVHGAHGSLKSARGRLGVFSGSRKLRDRLVVVSSPRRPTGSVVDNKYRILRLIGRGGMGDVYEAEHHFTKRRVALKVVHASALATPEAAARFFRETEATAAVSHPGVVDVLDAGREPGGALYAAFELLLGQDFETALRSDRVRPVDVLRVGVRLLDAVAAVHSRGFLHRDVKPGNVFLARARNGSLVVKLIDFGIAVSVEPESGVFRRQLGGVVGTIEYMSPEQAGGLEVDRRSDLWSIAALLFRGLSGRPPFVPGNFQKTLRELGSQRPPSLSLLRPDLPLDLVSVVDRGLERHPKDRWACAEDMAQALALCDLQQLTQAPSARTYLPEGTSQTPPQASDDTLHSPEPDAEAGMGARFSTIRVR